MLDGNIAGTTPGLPDRKLGEPGKCLTSGANSFQRLDATMINMKKWLHLQSLTHSGFRRAHSAATTQVFECVDIEEDTRRTG
jgi:hypothetical protein